MKNMKTLIVGIGKEEYHFVKGVFMEKLTVSEVREKIKDKSLYEVGLSNIKTGEIEIEPLLVTYDRHMAMMKMQIEEPTEKYQIELIEYKPEDITDERIEDWLHFYGNLEDMSYVRALYVKNPYEVLLTKKLDKSN